MPEALPPQDSLADIDARQDAVLHQLDELNRRLEQTLAEFGPRTEPTPQ